MKRQPDIDWALNASVISMLQNGLGYATIAEETGLSLGQVSYRAQTFELKASDYRHGRTAQARRIIESTACAKHNLTATRGTKYRVATMNMEAPSTA